jgi:hypothetical protein
MDKTTIEFYRDAIDKLESYTANEMDDRKVAEAEAKITDFRHKIIDAAWDDITQRTARLNELKAELQAVIDGADARTIGSTLTGLNGLVGELGDVVGS